MRAVVVGGSIAGSMAALTLARAGWAVTLVERDPLPLDTGPEGAWAAWPRPSVPQTGHSHNFYARIRSELRAELPDVLDRLMDAGVEEVRITDHAPAAVRDQLDAAACADLIALAARRGVFEWALSRAAEDETGVERRTADVSGITYDGGAVSGVVVDGEPIAADLVVDASGRRTRADAWFAAVGLAPAGWESSECGVGYHTRYYRYRPGVARPPLSRGFGGGANFPTHVVVTFPADRDTYSVTVGTPPWLDECRALREPEVFESLLQLSPASLPWSEQGAGEPITDVRVMAGLNNSIRRRMIDEPAPAGFVATGDAAMHTNPAAARGVSVAVLGALRLARIASQAPDRSALAEAWSRELGELASYYFDDVVQRDRERAEVWGATWSGRAPDILEVRPGVRFVDVVAATMVDAEVWTQFQRGVNLLDEPATAWSEPIAAKVRELKAAGRLPTPPEPPSTDAVLAALTASR
ncbi:MAG TPA: FAD-dependent oxidoreductase [Mycobacteriales bacterium]|nr:FAD-dependent oxidoreductase [Mycobacteriales bacterium]